MLGDFTLFDLLSEGCAIAGSITTSAANFLCAFCHDVEGWAVVVLCDCRLFALIDWP
jgi:hypothetical protein